MALGASQICVRKNGLDGIEIQTKEVPKKIASSKSTALLLFSKHATHRNISDTQDREIIRINIPGMISDKYKHII